MKYNVRGKFLQWYGMFHGNHIGWTSSSKTCYKKNFIDKTRPKEKWRKLYIVPRHVIRETQMLSGMYTLSKWLVGYELWLDWCVGATKDIVRCYNKLRVAYENKWNWL